MDQTEITTFLGNMVTAFSTWAIECRGSYSKSINSYLRYDATSEVYIAYAAAHYAFHLLRGFSRLGAAEIRGYDDNIIDMEGGLEAVEESPKESVAALLELYFRDLENRLTSFCKGYTQKSEAWFADAAHDNQHDYRDEITSWKEVPEDRDKLEFLWRAMILRAAEGSAVGATLKDDFRKRLDAIDEELKPVLGARRFPAPWADESFWWRTPIVAKGGKT